MHRLFWKIFLSFWAALILFAIAAIVAASSFIDRMHARQEALDPRARLMGQVAAAQSAADRGGAEALRAWLETTDRRELVPLYLIDARGEDLLGRPVPGFVADRYARRGERGAPDRGRRGRWAVVVTPEGGRYRLVPDFRAVTLGRVLRRPRVMALPVVVAAVVGALVCLLLARYLTAPLERLRLATERVAAGDLGHRVAPSLGRRRDEMGDLARAFDRMAERLEALMSLQRQLLRDVSHELRSPLARLQAALGLARQRAAGTAAGELDRIEREAERLNDLVGQLLSLARLESGSEPLAPEPVDLAALLASVVEDAAFEAGMRDRAIRLARTAPAPVMADERLLRQAVENVVRNAIRYTAAGSAVEVSLARVEPGFHRIRVRDHGPGVPEAMLPRLFEPFVRADDARGRTSGGYGLGLAIAERSLRVQGGRMAARNEPEGGLSVLVDVPEGAAPPGPALAGRAPRA